MGFPTRPSNVRVYQFHHFGTKQWPLGHELENPIIGIVSFLVKESEKG